MIKYLPYAYCLNNLVRRRVMFNFAKRWAKRLSLRPSRSEAPASHTKRSFVFRATEVEPLPNAWARVKLRYSKQGVVRHYYSNTDADVANMLFNKLGYSMPNLYVYHRYSNGLYQYNPIDPAAKKWLNIQSGKRLKSIIYP